MPDSECITRDIVLQKPQDGLTYPSSGQPTPPFTLNGQSFVNPPTSLKNWSEWRRKATASTDISNKEAYFANDQYYEVKLATENIVNPMLSRDDMTTLRYNGETYFLVRIILHKAVWVEKEDGERRSTPPQISLVFGYIDREKQQNKTFHMIIPIQYTNTPKDENIFLKFWLHRDPVGQIPRGTTYNDLLNFRGYSNNVRFATLKYCFTYKWMQDKEPVVEPYTVCIFKTPLKLNITECASWLQADPNLEKPDPIPTEKESNKSYRRKTFDEIYNLNRVNLTDRRLLSSEQIFDDDRTQTAVLPAYYKVRVEDLIGTTLDKQAVQKDFPTRTLQNVKCYPIDLVSNIDDAGNIYIDETTNRPIDLNTVSATAVEEIDPDLAQSVKNKQKQNESWTRFIIAFSIIFLILLALVIALVVFVFRGKSLIVPEAPPTGPLAELGASIGKTASNAADTVKNAVGAVNATANNAASVTSSAAGSR